MFKVEVIADNSGKWVGNLLRFDTDQEATAYALDLAMRWTAVKDWRVIPCSCECPKDRNVLIDGHVEYCPDWK